MSAASITNLSPAAFGSLLQAVNAAIPIADPQASLQPRAQGCDSVECRFLINDARSAIERLRRQLAGLEATPYSHHLRELNRGDCTMQTSGATSAAAPAGISTRRTYAVAAIGDVRPAATIAQDPRRFLSLRSATIVTNLGTLMNVLI